MWLSRALALGKLFLHIRTCYLRMGKWNGVWESTSLLICRPHIPSAVHLHSCCGDAIWLRNRRAETVPDFEKIQMILSSFSEYHWFKKRFCTFTLIRVVSYQFVRKYTCPSGKQASSSAHWWIYFTEPNMSNCHWR